MTSETAPPPVFWIEPENVPVPLALPMVKVIALAVELLTMPRPLMPLTIWFLPLRSSVAPPEMLSAPGVETPKGMALFWPSLRVAVPEMFVRPV